MSLFDSNFSEMPSILPVLPLTGAFLFPNGNISLRLFETRYIKLTFDALASARIIGMVQPIGETNNLHRIGCAGRIIGFAETHEDVLLVNLHGVSRFTIKRELPDRSAYRMVEADFMPFISDFSLKTPKIDRNKLFLKLDHYAFTKNIDFNSGLLKNEPDSTLLTTLASVLPFDRMEKQALLETPTPQDLLNALMMLLEADFGTKSN